MKIEITAKLYGAGKSFSKKAVKRIEKRLEQECVSYLKVFLNPQINEALFDDILKAKHEKQS